MKIGPALAAEFLEKNEGNRPQSPRTTARYAEAMRSGRWQYNPNDAIVIDEDGLVRNGQHRLNAVIQSGTTQEFDVLFGAPRELFAILDTQKPRGGGDVLAICGETHASLRAAALRWIISEEVARRRAQEGSTYRLRSEMVDNDLLLVARLEHPDLGKSLPIPDKFEPSRLSPPSITVWLHYRFSRIDPERATKYFMGIGRGEGITAGSPEWVIRTWLLKNLANNRKAHKEHVAAIIIKGWNKFFRGQKMQAVGWDPDKEGFPYVEGE